MKREGMDMAETLKLEIVTPEAIVFSEDVEMVTLPAIEGEMGIYPQHVRADHPGRAGRNHRHEGRQRTRSSRSARDWSK